MLRQPGGEPRFKGWMSPEVFEELFRRMFSGHLISLQNIYEVCNSSDPNPNRFGIIISNFDAE